MKNNARNLFYFIHFEIIEKYRTFAVEKQIKT